MTYQPLTSTATPNNNLMVLADNAAQQDLLDAPSILLSFDDQQCPGHGMLFLLYVKTSV